MGSDQLVHIPCGVLVSDDGHQRWERSCVYSVGLLCFRYHLQVWGRIGDLSDFLRQVVQAGIVTIRSWSLLEDALLTASEKSSFQTALSFETAHFFAEIGFRKPFWYSLFLICQFFDLC